jgi:hypothetical protein
VQNSAELARAARSAGDLVAQFGRRHDFAQEHAQQVELLSAASVRLVLPAKIHKIVYEKRIVLKVFT